jgi:hypothetical protein
LLLAAILDKYFAEDWILCCTVKGCQCVEARYLNAFRPFVAQLQQSKLGIEILKAQAVMSLAPRLE